MTPDEPPKDAPAITPTLFGSTPSPTGVMFKAISWRAEIERIEVSHVTDHYVYGTCRGKFGRHKKASLDARLFYSWDGARGWLASQAAARINHLCIQTKAAEYLARAVEALTDPGDA